MSASIRLAVTDDMGAIIAFGEDVVLPHYAPILGAEAAQSQLEWWTRDRIESAILAHRVHVAVDGGTVVGVCETGEFAGEQVIWKLYLAPDFRGYSLGAQLLYDAIDALPAGAGHVLVEHFAGNDRAGHFYQRQGFDLARTEEAPTGDPKAAVVWRRRDLDG